MKRPVISLEEIKKNRTPIRDVNLEYKQKLTSLEETALWITSHVGTMGFFFVIFFWTIIWLGWNVLGPKELQFDPYPAFVFWLFISNLVQIFLMPLIMIGQNLQGEHAERRAQADFEVNRKAEGEIENILIHLENQNDTLEEILSKLNK